MHKHKNNQVQTTKKHTENTYKILSRFSSKPDPHPDTGIEHTDQQLEWANYTTTDGDSWHPNTHLILYGECVSFRHTGRDDRD